MGNVKGGVRKRMHSVSSKRHARARALLDVLGGFAFQRKVSTTWDLPLHRDKCESILTAGKGHLTAWHRAVRVLAPAATVHFLGTLSAQHLETWDPWEVVTPLQKGWRRERRKCIGTVRKGLCATLCTGQVQGEGSSLLGQAQEIWRGFLESLSGDLAPCITFASVKALLLLGSQSYHPLDKKLVFGLSQALHSK